MSWAAESVFEEAKAVTAGDQNSKNRVDTLKNLIHSMEEQEQDYLELDEYLTVQKKAQEAEKIRSECPAF